MINILFLILILLGLIIEAYIESIRGDKHNLPSYLVLGATIVLFELIAHKIFKIDHGWLYYISYRVMFFNFIFNFFRGDDLKYLSDRGTDKIEQRIGHNTMLIIRAILLIFTTIKLFQL